MKSLFSETLFLEQIAQRYEPTENEIIECAKWLGIDIEHESDLLWIARDALKESLPICWKPCKKGDNIYYFNFQTGESVWDRPCDQKYKILVQREQEKRLKPPEKALEFDGSASIAEMKQQPHVYSSKARLFGPTESVPVIYVDGKWDTRRRGTDIRLSDDGTTATRSSDEGWMAVLGMQAFDQGTGTVAFKMEKKQWYVAVGIAMSDVELNEDPTGSIKTIVLGAGLGNLSLFGKEMGSFGGGYDTGDVIRIEVNVDQHTATFYKNEVELCTASGIIPGMKPFLSLGDRGSIVRTQCLNGFSCVGEMLAARARGFYSKQDLDRGFESADEMRGAAAKGFFTREEVERGFASAEEMKEAMSKGFQTKADFDRGFSSPQEMKKAQERGFHNKAQFEKGFDSAHEMCLAHTKGFVTKQEMLHALARGFSNTADWNAARLVIPENLSRALTLSDEEMQIFSDPYAPRFFRQNYDQQSEMMAANIIRSMEYLKSLAEVSDLHAEQISKVTLAVDVCFDEQGQLSVNMSEWASACAQMCKSIPLLAAIALGSNIEPRVAKGVCLLRDQVDTFSVRLERVCQVIHRAETYMQYLHHRHEAVKDNLSIFSSSLGLAKSVSNSVRESILLALGTSTNAAKMAYENAQGSLKAVEVALSLSRSAHDLSTSLATSSRAAIQSLDRQLSRLDRMESKDAAAMVREVPKSTLQLASQTYSSAEKNATDAEELFRLSQIHVETTSRIFKSAESELERVKSMVPDIDAEIDYNEERVKKCETEIQQILQEIRLLQAIIAHLQEHRSDLEDYEVHARNLLQKQERGLEILRSEMLQMVHSRERSFSARLQEANLGVLSADDIFSVLVNRGLPKIATTFFRHRVDGNVLQEMLRTSLAAQIRFDDELDDFLENNLQLRDVITRKRVIHLIQLMQYGLDINDHCPSNTSTSTESANQPCCVWSPQMILIELKKQNLLHLAEPLAQVTGDVLLLLHRRKDLIKLGIDNTSEQQRLIEFILDLSSRDPVASLRLNKLGNRLRFPSPISIGSPLSSSTTQSISSPVLTQVVHPPVSLRSKHSDALAPAFDAEALSPPTGIAESKRNGDVSGVLFPSTQQHTVQSQGLPITMNGTKSHCAIYERIRANTNEFSDANLIGEGSSGRVYQCQLGGSGLNGTGVMNCVVKRCLTQGSTKSEMGKEIESLLLCKHQNLVPLLATCLSPDGSERLLVHPCMPGGSLQQRLLENSSMPSTRLQWSQRLRIACEIIRATIYLHGSSRTKPAMVHTNIKPSNVFFDGEGRARLSDVGTAYLGSVKPTSLGYTCPIFVSEGHFYPTCDGFSVGVILLQLLTSQPAIHPGPSMQPRALAARLRRLGPSATAAAADVDAAFPPPVADTLAQIGLLLVQQEEQDRMGLSEALQRLEDLPSDGVSRSGGLASSGILRGSRRSFGASTGDTTSEHTGPFASPEQASPGKRDMGGLNIGWICGGSGGGSAAATACAVCLVAPRQQRVAPCGHRVAICAACREAQEESGGAGAGGLCLEYWGKPSGLISEGRPPKALGTAATLSVAPPLPPWNELPAGTLASSARTSSRSSADILV